MFSALGKFTVLTFGLIGSFLALIILVLWGTIHTLIGAFGDSPAGPNRVGWGLLLIGIGVVASFLSLFLSRISSILFLIAGIGLFWVISGCGDHPADLLRDRRRFRLRRAAPEIDTPHG